MNNLKRIRLERNMTQIQLAEACGINQSDLSRYENGICEPSLATLRKFAEVLECTVDDLIRIDEPEKQMA